MKLIPTSLPDVLLVEPTVHKDERGFFLESYNRRRFVEAGIEAEFVQDNHSRSSRHVLRGLHYQVRRPQGKLVRVVAGSVYDVAVAVRRGSPTFGSWVGEILSAENFRMLWIPRGFAHGFLVLSEHAEVVYKTTDYYAPDCERCIVWNDPELDIAWPMEGRQPVVSVKDANGVQMQDADLGE